MNEPVFTQDWISPYFPLWEKILDGRDVNEILEIGSFEGRSTLWFLNRFKDACVTCIDTFEGGKDHKELGVDFSATKERFISNLTPYSDRFVLYQGESEDVLTRIATRRKESFDLVLIDGSHIARHVLQDAVISWRMLRDGGVMIFDDFGWSGGRPPWETPKPAIDAFMACYLDQYKLLEKGYQVILEKL